MKCVRFLKNGILLSRGSAALSQGSAALSRGSAALSRGRVVEWHKRFREGQMNAEDERRGRPPSSRTDDAKARISEMLDQDKRNKRRLWGFLCQRIVTGDLAMKQVAAKFTLKLLNSNKKNHILFCQDMRQSLADDPDLLFSDNHWR